MSKSLRPAYVASLLIVVSADSAVEASEGISELLRDAEERHNPNGTIVDWKFVNLPETAKPGTPEGTWSKVLISADHYEEGEFFDNPDASVVIHKDWYHDGIESNEDLWRIDPERDIQVQLFAQVNHPGAIPPVYTGKWRLFIEHDVREAVGSVKRVKYSGKAFEIKADLPYVIAKRLLAMNATQVQDYLATEIAEVKALPDDPRYH